jgi:hypothetical protein
MKLQCFHHCIATAPLALAKRVFGKILPSTGGTAMLKGEAEQMIRRTREEQGKEPMSEEEVSFLADIIMKIASRIVEEAVANWNTNKPGSKPSFFS